MSKELNFIRLPTDKWFEDSPDCGDPECTCSRCDKIIEEDDCPPIRIFNLSKNQEQRYHRNCIEYNEWVNVS